MSRQSEAQKAQGYRPAAARQCANCMHYSSKTEEVKTKYNPRPWIKESEIRCTLGGFAVTRTAICDRWALRG